MSVNDPSRHNQPEVVAEFPLSAVQQQFWVLDQIEPGTPALNVAVRWGLSGAFNPNHIERAFAHVIDRHEILRSRFADRDGVPVQEVVDRADFKLGLVDLRATPDAVHEDRVQAIALEDAAKSFDLTKPGLIRATLVQLAADRAVLLIAVHHIAFDGYSIGVLGREIGEVAEALDAGQAPALPELPLQYGDVCLWQEELFSAGIMDAETAYWADTLAGAPYFELPTDHPRPPMRGSDVDMVTRDLPEGFGDHLDATARALDVSNFALGSAVLAACLHRLTGAEEVLFGTQVAGRNEVDLEPLIGAFINTLVLRLHTRDSMRFADLATQGKEVISGALTHQTLPFTELITRLNVPREGSRTPLISVNFNLSRVFMQGRRHGTFEMTSQPSHTPGATYDLNIGIIGRPSGWRLMVDYAPALYDRATIEDLVDALAQGFQAVFADPQATLSQMAPTREVAKPDTPLTRIEAALEQHQAVGRAAAIETPSGPYAFVCPPPQRFEPLERLPEVLARHLRDHLPEGAQPTGISVLAGLPQDRSLLLPPGQTAAPSAPLGVLDPLRDIWADCLGVSAPPAEASFFDLGGSSLLAVRLLTRIRKTWPLRLSIADVYATPTLAGMAALIEQKLGGSAARPKDDWRILPLATEGKAPAIFGFNNVGTMLATAQSRHGGRQAFCVRLFDGERGDDIAGLGFVEIAALYAKAVQRAQPQGPYVLFGLCVHGNLALETARILRAKGHEATVVLKDVWEPGYAAQLRGKSSTRWRESFHALGERLRRVRDGTMSLSAMLGSYRLIRKSGVLHLAAWLGLIDRVRATDLDPLQEKFTSALSRARDAYRPAPYDGRVLHVVTKFSPRGRGFKPSIGWEDVVTGTLRTVNIDEVLVFGDRCIGTDDLAREIELFVESP